MDTGLLNLPLALKGAYKSRAGGKENGGVGVPGQALLSTLKLATDAQQERRTSIRKLLIFVSAPDLLAW